MRLVKIDEHVWVNPTHVAVVTSKQGFTYVVMNVPPGNPGTTGVSTGVVRFFVSGSVEEVAQKINGHNPDPYRREG